ncbi:hypothetical protein BDF14DRAFT_1829615 [Spinellus fusiger]|nr:hypothetical protein BDF14DRAFT_1829615 [Spinellus fusiger]
MILTHELPDMKGTEGYRKVPFTFIDEYSNKSVVIKLPNQFSPLERILLQASGNIQRILSAYYNESSYVEVIKNKKSIEDTEEASKEPAFFERRVAVKFGSTYAYEAESVLIVRDPVILELIEKHKFSLGQIFNHIQKTPDFTLLAVGRHSDAPGAGFWRDYTLSTPDKIYCFIREIFREGLFETFQGEAINGTVWVQKGGN